MRATIVDLRYQMKKVLAALNRNEKITVLYHNKEIASIVPIGKQNKTSVEQHPFFGMLQNDTQSVEEQIRQLRRGRYRDI